MKIIGLTGPTGSGKTVFSEVAKALGIYVLNADEIAHETLKKEKTAEKLTKVFGCEILSGGIVDRKKLGKIAFSSYEATEKLNQTVLPLIVEDIKNTLSKIKSEFVLLDAPTLFESGLDSECDYIISVISDENIRKSRIVERDSLSEEAALLRLSAAKSDEFFISRSSHIIFNNGSIEHFKTEAESVILSIMN